LEKSEKQKKSKKKSEIKELVRSNMLIKQYGLPFFSVALD